MQKYSTIQTMEGDDSILIETLEAAARGSISEWSALVIWNEDLGSPTERVLLVMVAGKEVDKGFPTGGAIVPQNQVDSVLEVFAFNPYFARLDTDPSWCKHQIPMPYVKDIDETPWGQAIILGEMRTVTVAHRGNVTPDEALDLVSTAAIEAMEQYERLQANN